MTSAKRRHFCAAKALSPVTFMTYHRLSSGKVSVIPKFTLV
jgi:hypothetical protein